MPRSLVTKRAAHDHVSVKRWAYLLCFRLKPAWRMQGYWAEGGSWWPAMLEQILPTGDELELRVDPTATNRDVIPLPLTLAGIPEY